MGDANTPEACAACGRPADFRCDQCQAPLCAAHRVEIRGGLGTWSRCESCRLRNRIRESPLIRLMRWENELDTFVNLVWLMVLAAVILFAVFYRAYVGPAHGPR